MATADAPSADRQPHTVIEQNSLHTRLILSAATASMSRPNFMNSNSMREYFSIKKLSGPINPKRPTSRNESAALAPTFKRTRQQIAPQEAKLD